MARFSQRKRIEGAFPNKGLLDQKKPISTRFELIKYNFRICVLIFRSILISPELDHFKIFRVRQMVFFVDSLWFLVYYLWLRNFSGRNDR